MDINSDKVRSDIHTEFKKKHKPIGPEPVPVPAPVPGLVWGGILIGIEVEDCGPIGFL